MNAPFAVENIPVDDVFIVGERRDADAAAVGTLAESIKRLGLQTPITVRVDENIPDPETGEIMGAYALIAGRHRLEAYRKLGFDRIPAVVRDCTEVEAELWEIAENLHRVDLTKDERDRQIRRYGELLEEQERVVPQVAAKLSVRGRVNEGRPKSIARRIAEETGLSDDTVRRALNPQPPKPKPVTPAAAPLRDDETLEQWLAQMMRLWNRAPRDWREAFMERVDTPVMDADDLEIPPALRRTA